MKKTATDDRYEEQGSPLCWVCLFIAAMWGMIAYLRMEDGNSFWSVAGCLLLVAASLLCTIDWLRYRLVVDEKGIFQQQSWAKITLPWAEIGRITIHNKVSLWKATGITFHHADGKKRSLYINKTDILPLVQKYASCPIETDQ